MTQRRSRRGLRILCWNVNGIRAAARKGLAAWFHRARPDVLGLQETRAEVALFPPELNPPRGYHLHAVSAVKRGYSGCATFSRQAPRHVVTTLGRPVFDDEARFVATEYGSFLLYNVYFPKGSGTARDNSRVSYKLDFYAALMGHALRARQRTGKGAVVMGDFNTAHTELDLANPRGNVRNSGFLPEERADLDRWLRRGFVDTFRALHPRRVQYSWWRNTPGVRERNVGWRIDMVWVTADLLPRVRQAFILDDVQGSDHAPVGIVLAEP